MGKIEQLIGVTVDTGKKLYRDSSINAGTLALFDASNAWAGGKADIAAGGTLKSLDYADTTGTFSKAHTYQGGGMLWPGVAADQFNLPAECAPLPTDKNFLFSVWAKISAIGNASFNNQTFSFSTANSNSTPASMLTLVPTSPDSGVTASTIELRFRGVNTVVTTVLAPFYDGAVHQLGIQGEVNDAGTLQRLSLYMDGIKLWTSGWVSVGGTIPATPTVRYVGTSSTFAKSWTGAFYRVRKDDLTLTDLTADEIIAADYAAASSRFS